MTFEEWFHSRENDDEDAWHDIVWEDGPHKGRDVAKWLEIAFEAGHDACIDGLIGGSDSSEWVEWRVEDLVECKYENPSS